MSEAERKSLRRMQKLVATQIECPQCGYNLTGATIGATCPECGTLVGEGLIPEKNAPTSLRALLALMLGLVSVMGWWWFSPLCFLAGPFAVQVALRAKIQAERGEITPSSGSVAHMGLICGFIGTMAGVFFLLYVMGRIMFG